jgi:hypothetical protein
MMKFVYIAFIIGIPFPIVFPITMCALFNSQVVDKLSLAYFYRAPPKYDDKLAKTAKRILYGAVFAGFISSYWTLGNQAMFLDPTLFKEL